MEDVINNALNNYLPGLEPTNNVRVDFYSRFKREADDRDRDLVEKYSGALDITLIFVSFSMPFGHNVRLVLLGNRLVCSPPSHPLSSPSFKSSSNRTTLK